MDKYNTQIRSKIMKSVKSSENKSTELKFINILKLLNLKHWKRKYNVIGKPDFVFINYKLAIFLDGCFWHGHDCRKLKPTSNQEYWEQKIITNKKRDKKIDVIFTNRGWNVIRFWECQLKNISIIKRKLKKCIKID